MPLVSALEQKDPLVEGVQHRVVLLALRSMYPQNRPAHVGNKTLDIMTHLRENVPGGRHNNRLKDDPL